jgi:L-fuculose-phosphate aldolase
VAIYSKLLSVCEPTNRHNAYFWPGELANVAKGGLLRSSPASTGAAGSFPATSPGHARVNPEVIRGAEVMRAGSIAAMLERERERVAAAARRLASQGLVLGTAGNVSERAGELVAITPTGAVLERLDASQVAVVDLEGTLVDGPSRPTSELALHLGAYRRYGAGAVVHAHAPVSTALACVLDEVPAVHYQMVALGGPVRVARYATFGTVELAELTLDALEDRFAVLMANHGTLAYGEDLESAVERSLLLEWACTVYWHAAAIGAPRALDDQQLVAVRDELEKRDYGSLLGVQRS